MKKKLLVAGLAFAALSAPAWAILGLGDIVFDPSNLAQAVKELAQLEQEYAQLVQTYHTIDSQYQQMLWMAKSLPATMTARYRALATPWTLSGATNTYGTSTNWVSAINTGLNVSTGYSSATEPLNTYGSALGNIPADQVDRIKTSYATVELTDGANQSAIQTLGALRAHAPAVEAAIGNLESDSLSGDPAMNTEIAVLNKINAAGVIGLRNTQDANKLLAALAEERILESKRERDAEARAFNEHIQFMSQGQAAMAAQAAEASSAMLAWRMP